jgi:hypothetical protein
MISPLDPITIEGVKIRNRFELGARGAAGVRGGASASGGGRRPPRDLMTGDACRRLHTRPGTAAPLSPAEKEHRPYGEDDAHRVGTA